jgi:hypothetical protein
MRLSGLVVTGLCVVGCCVYKAKGSGNPQYSIKGSVQVRLQGIAAGYHYAPSVRRTGYTKENMYGKELTQAFAPCFRGVKPPAVNASNSSSRKT